MANRRQYFRPSNVDETLFASKTKRVQSAPSGRRPASTPTATYITSSELDKIKGNAVITSEEEIQEAKRKIEQEKREREITSRERILRMKELEKKALIKAQKTDIEVANQARADAMRKYATEKIDNDHDLVKNFESLASRAAAFTIRDHQIAEKKRREEVERDYNRRMDMEMEIDRLKDLKRREDEEKIRHQKILADRDMINEQLEYIRREKLLAMEARESENMKIRKMCEGYKEEDREKERLRLLDIEKSKQEIAKANADAIRIKKERKEAEKKEIQDILLYQAERDAELQRRENLELAEAHKKKETQAKLLAQQEKAQNNQEKIDELRARRAAEEYERKERQKEKEQREKIKRENLEMLKARQLQAEEKRRYQELEKERKKREYMDALEYSKKLAERERNESNETARKAATHKAELQKQLDELEFQRKTNISNNKDLGIQRKHDLIKEEEKLTVIRDKMMNDLIVQGVNPKYLAEMKNVDIKKQLMR